MSTCKKEKRGTSPYCQHPYCEFAISYPYIVLLFWYLTQMYPRVVALAVLHMLGKMRRFILAYADLSETVIHDRHNCCKLT